MEQADRPVGAWPTARSPDGMPAAGRSHSPTQLLGFPRHLGIHSGGMVICDRPVSEVVPVEWARMEGRTRRPVGQGRLRVRRAWSSSTCSALGMLTALHLTQDLVFDHNGEKSGLFELQATDPAVYEMLQSADSVGVFQVESRAQMATLPRLKPREFYDLVVEVALIRPGPIQGGSVHPYIRRRNGVEKRTYDHPLLEERA